MIITGTFLCVSPALKHHTSKLSQFSDLDDVSTFGFRGEALSSLCALTDGMSVTTRHSSQAVGTKIHFDNNGAICRQESAPRKIGTDVKVTSIFSTMPVRLKEFERNLKREFAKMIKILQVCTSYHGSLTILPVGKHSQPELPFLLTNFTQSLCQQLLWFNI